MKAEYIETINRLMNDNNDIELLDLILQLLTKCKGDL